MGKHGALTSPAYGKPLNIQPKSKSTIRLLINFQSQPVSKTGLGCVGITDNCIVLAEGRMQMNKTFRVHALGFPPLEQRQDTEAAAKVPINSLNPVHASPSKLVNCRPCLACRLECPSARSAAHCARAWYCVAQEHQR